MVGFGKKFHKRLADHLSNELLTDEPVLRCQFARHWQGSLVYCFPVGLPHSHGQETLQMEHVTDCFMCYRCNSIISQIWEMTNVMSQFLKAVIHASLQSASVME